MTIDQPDGEEKEMKSRTESKIAFVAALFVLFCAMLNPLITVVISLVALAALGVFRFLQKNK
jgi:hypothetical protein